MTPRELEEYRSLRATIHERGTTRVWTFVAGLSAWALLVVATAAVNASPAAALLPLLVLAAVFEAVFALHTGVERIGRYLQVFYEDSFAERRWEHTIMAFGRTFPGGGSDPLFASFFWMATAANLVPAILAAPRIEEWVLTGAAHALFLARVTVARGQSARQRPTDLERFERLKRDLAVDHDEVNTGANTGATELTERAEPVRPGS
ncbi:MAG: hypothetical protein GEU82_06130 [Luteitalea sp.]|nr:hypothetical protein [Luteitalea sp.]